jgi:hypothetical protein
MDTVLISSRDFRSNQRKYFEKVDDGQTNLIIKRGQRFYALVPADLSLIANPKAIEKLKKSNVKPILKSK